MNNIFKALFLFIICDGNLKFAALFHKWLLSLINSRSLILNMKMLIGKKNEQRLCRRNQCNSLLLSVFFYSVLFFSTTNINAQTCGGSLGDPVINQTFGGSGYSL